ncbi:MAG: PAS domain S-box protein [Desulfobacterota bacterium]|nr:PAS domain S-box protein [Thermodesulfobacteriota bacterium]
MSRNKKVKKEERFPQPETEHLLSDIFASIQDGLSILDRELTIIRVNPTVERWYAHAMPLVGKKCYEVYCKRAERCEICPAHQTLQTGQKATAVVPKVGENAEITAWLELHTFPLLDPATNQIRGVIEYIRDITSSIEDEVSLRRKDAILEALGFASKSFLGGTGWLQSIEEVLRRLGKASEVSRVYIFENHLGPEGDLLTSQRYEWVDEGIEPQIDNPQLQNFSFLKMGFSRWVELLGRGEVIQGHVKEFPEKEREFLGLQDIQSILVVPVFVGERWWGFIGFDECRRERTWTKAEVEALRYAAEIFGAAIRHRRAEEALKASEERYRTLVEESFDGIWIQKGMKIIFANRRLYEMLGYEEGELIGLDHWRVYHPDYQSLTRERAMARLRGESPPSTYEVKFLRKDGTSFWGEINAKVISYLEEPGIQVWARDIDERKRAEEVLRESEKRYRSLFENAVEGIYRSSIEGRFLEVNPAMARIFGYESPEEMIEEIKDIAAQFYAEPYQRKIFIQALKEGAGKVLGLEYEALRKDGTKIWIRDSARAVFGKDGAMLFLEGFIEDITLRKRAEEILRTERERFKSLLENAPFGMVLIGQEGTFRYINSKFVELFGYDSQDIPDGRTWFRKAHPDPDYRRQVISTWLEDSRWLASGEKRSRIFSVKCQDGTQKIVNFMIVRLDTGEHLMTCEDITELKRAEEALRQTEEQLRHAQKMEAIGRLAGGIAHDFNNLLTVIKGYAELSCLHLDRDNLLYGNLEEILKASERASTLTRQLLAFSRRQMLEFKVINLNTLLKDLNKMLHRILGEDIELDYHLSEDLGKIKTDPGQMEQVLLNLAVNARDAMPNGGRLIIETSNVDLTEEEVRNRLEMKPGPYVRLTVSDNGVGMSPEVKERIFEPFFTTKEKGKGTGLGLSTVYGIVKQSGGHIAVFSELGLGTTFKIYLPRVEEEEDPLWRKERSNGVKGGTEAVLLVEDEPAVRELAARVLRERGYRVEVAKDGNEALAVIRNQPQMTFDLLLTDVVMPGMSGREIADVLKSSMPNLKVLYMSGYTEDSILRHGVLREGVDLLQKPFSPETLVKRVREILDREVGDPK